MGELDVPGGLATVLTAGVVGGVEPSDGLGNQPVGDHGAAADPLGELVVDPACSCLREAPGLLDDAAGLPGRDDEATYPLPQLRVPVLHVHDVGHQVPCRGG